MNPNGHLVKDSTGEDFFVGSHTTLEEAEEYMSRFWEEVYKLKKSQFKTMRYNSVTTTVLYPDKERWYIEYSGRNGWLAPAVLKWVESNYAV